MKTKPVFTLAEAAKKAGLAEQTVSEYLEQKVLTPSVVADNAEPLFAENDLLHLEQIRHLSEAGYSTTEIKKITRKIGLPQPEKVKKKQKKVHRLLTVGELAKRSGLNARTIKYWEERGIIEPTTRSEGGFRLYDEKYVLFCNLIHDLQLFGYSLVEIKETADLFRIFYDITTEHFAGSEAEILKNLNVMLEKITTLSNRMDELTKGIERWRKLLKEKKSEIQGLGRKLSKERGKVATARRAKAESAS